MKSARTRIELLREFDDAPPNTLFDQVTTAAVRNCSPKSLERDRWLGGGIPYRKIGRAVRYCKRDILDWLEKFETVNSSSQVRVG
ncbi:MAG: DNA-binding protein [Magnetococcales bacterium]|nr:DNA-binding protein [Magnetococcales bacterium]